VALQVPTDGKFPWKALLAPAPIRKRQVFAIETRTDKFYAWPIPGKFELLFYISFNIFPSF